MIQIVLDSAQSDHHGKRFARMSIEGEHLLNWRYTCMNSIGQTAVAVNVESCSYNDATLVEAHRTQRLVAQREGHAPCELATVDNPHKDQAGVSAALWAGDGKHTFRFPADGEIKMIVTQEECDEACSHLRTFAEIGFDTESIAYIDGSGSNAKHAAVAQLCGDGKVCYISFYTSGSRAIDHLLRSWPHRLPRRSPTTSRTTSLIFRSAFRQRVAV